ncbi:MAG: hypothetical protein PHO01_12700 [Desulfotomaculaceae bacterium]|nr:hypothetical protein [Desulfotomaculaceae bacterium]
MIFTSNFKIAGHLPQGIAVCRSVPRGWRGRRYPALAPSKQLLQMGLKRQVDHGTWAILYKKQVLDNLDPQKVLSDLGGDNFIMLCWEAPGEVCHRRQIAHWLEEKLGIEVPELNLRLKAHTSWLREMAVL